MPSGARASFSRAIWRRPNSLAGDRAGERRGGAPVTFRIGRRLLAARRSAVLSQFTRRMTILYLVSFIGGLLLAVRVMIFGVERARADHPAGERTFRLSPAVIAVTAVVFGVAGYVLDRPSIGGPVRSVSMAALLAVISGMATARWVRRWWSITPEHEVEDVRYQLQGHLAQVTKPIEIDQPGEVTFELAGERRVLRARHFEQGALAAGTDVVIERIEDEVAYVEAWQEVEKRL
jgi:membrane protein implicated in regulation of membrane protease activity